VANSAAKSLESTAQDREDLKFMCLALDEARKGAAEGEVPVGAVLVHNGSVISHSHNHTERKSDPTAHAEILCIREASRALGQWRLLESTLYVTLEPCPMCAGAVLQARLGTIVYGAPNTLIGAAGSWVRLLADSSTPQPVAAGVLSPNRHAFHPDMRVRSGILREECASVMREFFRRRRQEAAAAREPSPMRTPDSTVAGTGSAQAAVG